MRSVRDYKFNSREECWRFWRLAVGMDVEVIAGMIPYYAGSPMNYIVKIQKATIQYSRRYKAYQLMIFADDTPFIGHLSTPDFTPKGQYLWNPNNIIHDQDIIHLEQLFLRVCKVSTDLLLLLAITNDVPGNPSCWSRFVQHPLCDFGGLYRLRRDFWRVAS